MGAAVATEKGKGGGCSVWEAGQETKDGPVKHACRMGTRGKRSRRPLE